MTRSRLIAGTGYLEPEAAMMWKMGGTENSLEYRNLEWLQYHQNVLYRFSERFWIRNNLHSYITRVSLTATALLLHHPDPFLH